jgi:hypothetical protein
MRELFLSPSQAHARLRAVLAAEPDRPAAHEAADHDPVGVPLRIAIVSMLEPSSFMPNTNPAKMQNPPVIPSFVGFSTPKSPTRFHEDPVYQHVYVAYPGSLRWAGVEQEVALASKSAKRMLVQGMIHCKRSARKAISGLASRHWRADASS